MAGIIPFGADVDLCKNQIKNARFDNLATASAPSSPVVGQMYYDTTVNCNMCWNGTVWIPQSMDTATYRTIRQGGGSLIAGNADGTYYLTLGATVLVNCTSGTNNAFTPAMIYITSSYYPIVNGLAPKLKIRGTVAPNHQAFVGGTITFGLYPLTSVSNGGSIGNRIHVLGTVITGSTASSSTFPNLNYTLISGSDFSLPADGWYVVGFVKTGTIPANGFIEFQADLLIHNG